MCSSARRATRKSILSYANEAKVVTDGAEDDVGGIAGATFEIAAAQVTFCLLMSDHRLDGGAVICRRAEVYVDKIWKQISE